LTSPAFEGFRQQDERVFSWIKQAVKEGDLIKVDQSPLAVGILHPLSQQILWANETFLWLIGKTLGEAKRFTLADAKQNIFDLGDRGFNFLSGALRYGPDSGPLAVDYFVQRITAHDQSECLLLVICPLEEES